MKISFTKHPKKLKETYLQHLMSALLYAGTLMGAFVVCLIHAFLPFLFENTGGDMINRLSTSINKRNKENCGCAKSNKTFKKTTPKRKKNKK